MIIAIVEDHHRQQDQAGLNRQPAQTDPSRRAIGTEPHQRGREQRHGDCHRQHARPVSRVPDATGTDEVEDADHQDADDERGGVDAEVRRWRSGRRHIGQTKENGAGCAGDPDRTGSLGRLQDAHVRNPFRFHVVAGERA
jgi:hypothetical protein